MPQSNVTFDIAEAQAYLLRCGEALRRHQRGLTTLDAALGDGDHGDNMVIGFRAVEALAASPAAASMSVGELLQHAGHVLVASVGGASGPLYGTAFLEAGFRIGEQRKVDAGLLADALRVAARGLARRGRCQLGDKTILDTLRPASEAFAEAIRAGAGLDIAAAAMFRAAASGMRSTRPLVARRGLALRLGSRSAGHVDPGAASAFLLLRALQPGRRSPSRRSPADAPAAVNR